MQLNNKRAEAYLRAMGKRGRSETRAGGAGDGAAHDEPAHGDQVQDGGVQDEQEPERHAQRSRSREERFREGQPRDWKSWRRPAHTGQGQEERSRKGRKRASDQAPDLDQAPYPEQAHDSENGVAATGSPTIHSSDQRGVHSYSFPSFEDVPREAAGQVGPDEQAALFSFFSGGSGPETEQAEETQPGTRPRKRTNRRDTPDSAGAAPGSFGGPLPGKGFERLTGARPRPEAPGRSAARTQEREAGPEHRFSRGAPKAASQAGTESAESSQEAQAAESGRKAREVAILISALGAEPAAEVLRRLSEPEVERIAAEVTRLGEVPREEARAVFEKVGRAEELRDGPVRGGVQMAREALTRAFGEERAEQLVTKAAPDGTAALFSFLDGLEVNQIRTLLNEESPMVVAAITACASAETGSRILRAMHNAARVATVKRMAGMEALSPEVLRTTAKRLKERMREIGTSKVEQVDGPGALAGILRHMDRDELLGTLRESSPELAKSVEEQLFTIEQLTEIEDKGLQTLLRDLDDREIALLLKGKSEEVRAKIMRNLSERRQEIVSSEYRSLGAQPKKEVAEATRDFIRRVREGIEEGEILVRRDNDRYI